MRHFLDEQGEIPEDMHKDARELAGFFAMVIDSTTTILPASLTPIDIRCFKKGCHGIIRAASNRDTEEIHWKCPVCDNAGIISNWQGTKWDNR